MIRLIPNYRNYTFGTILGGNVFTYVDSKIMYNSWGTAPANLITIYESSMARIRGNTTNNYHEEMTRVISAPSDKMGWIDTDQAPDNAINVNIDYFCPGYIYGVDNVVNVATAA